MQAKKNLIILATVTCALALYIYHYQFFVIQYLLKSKISPYKTEEVMYLNPESGLYLAGTLTVPYSYKKSPVVLLVAGTGRHDRNCTMKGHNLFEAIANYLAFKGIATLRYDKRGVEKSQGTFDTNLTTQDFASDAQAGITFLKNRKEIDQQKIGMLGHSEGGLVSCMVAAESNAIAFLILMASAGTTLINDIVEQACLQIKADGASFDLIHLDRLLRKKMLSIVHEETNLESTKQLLQQAVDKHLKTLTAEQTKQAESLVFASNQNYFEPQAPVYTISKLNSDYMIKVFNSPWIRFLLNLYVPGILRKIKAPTIIINGQFDFIVASQVTTPIFEKNLINCKHEFVEIPQVNHWFESCKNGSIAEYGNSSEIISPLFLEIVGKFIEKVTK